MMQEINRKLLIFCEGNTDWNFFDALLKMNEALSQYRDDFQIISFDGFNKFKKVVGAYKLRPNFNEVEKIFIACDSDDSTENHFRSLQGSLRKLGLPTPNELLQWSASSPQILIYLFPNNSDVGMLETLCFQSVDSQDHLDCINGFEDCLEEKGIDIFNPHKMRISALIAAHSGECGFGQSGDRSECGLGLATKKGIIDVTSDVFTDLRRVLLQMAS